MRVKTFTSRAALALRGLWAQLAFELAQEREKRSLPFKVKAGQIVICLVVGGLTGAVFGLYF